VYLPRLKNCFGWEKSSDALTLLQTTLPSVLRATSSCGQHLQTLFKNKTSPILLEKTMCDLKFLSEMKYMQINHW